LRELYEKYRENRKAIHIEQFTFDVITSAISGQAVHKEIAILFDYGNRDPLNKAAKITILD